MPIFWYLSPKNYQLKRAVEALLGPDDAFLLSWVIFLGHKHMPDYPLDDCGILRKSFMLILDPTTQRPLTQARFQFDADLAGNLNNSHSTSAHIGYIGHSVVSFTSKTQGSLSTSTAESEIKAVNQCLKEEALALRGMLNLMGFPQDATIIEEDNQACVYASEIPHMTRGMRHLDLAELLIKDKWMLRKSNFLKCYQLKRL